MKKKNLPLFENITITDVAAEGKALARVNDIVVFVPWCVPGDVVDIQITKKKHSFMEGRVVRFVKLSEKRSNPVCPHYGTCGGCKWQILPYDEQLKYKQQQITDQLTRIGKVQLPDISPILGSVEQYEYRNKLEFTFADRRWISWDDINQAGGLDQVEKLPGLGFHIPDSFDKVLHINQCRLMNDANNTIRNHIYAFAMKNGMSLYNQRTNEGLLRNLIFRRTEKNEWMVIVVFGEDNKVQRDLMLGNLKQTFPEIVSLMYVVNQKLNDTISDLDIKLYSGQDYIIEQMEDLSFRVGPKSFYQTNTRQAYRLYSVVRRLAELKETDLVYDLYTGTGTIANFVARQCRKVIGIEYVADAIEDAKVNSEINKIDNTLFFAGDMKDVLNDEFLNRYGKPDVIITDPPRAGMHEDVVSTILRAQPKRIVYVSCNPATQARDLALLDEKYKVVAVQPVDMFPQTQHVENVVKLEMRF